MRPAFTLSDIDGLGFVKVSDKVDVPLIRIVEGVNEVTSVNGAGWLTVSVALAVLTPPFEVTELVAVNVPAVVPVTGAVIVQDAPAAKVNGAMVNEGLSTELVIAPPFWQVEVTVVNGLTKVRPVGA